MSSILVVFQKNLDNKVCTYTNLAVHPLADAYTIDVSLGRDNLLVGTSFFVLSLFKFFLPKQRQNKALQPNQLGCSFFAKICGVVCKNVALFGCD